MTDRIKVKDKINNILGICCYHLLPIKQEYYIGKGKIIGICTLSSLDLLKEIKNNQEIMNKISIVGRLLSENKGLDEIIKFTINNKSLKYLLLCGEEVKGHLSGQTLIALKRNGIDQNKRIINAAAPYPFLACSDDEIEYFRHHINIINKIGLKDIYKIKDTVFDIKTNELE
jgi:tetrahydromethanopterin S-methyltransferase subunit A